MRLLSVSRSVAILCWATVWAVLLSVQLHLRQPVDQRTAEGTEAKQPGPGFGGTSEPQSLSPPQGSEEKPLSPESRLGQVWACVGQVWNRFGA